MLGPRALDALPGSHARVARRSRIPLARYPAPRVGRDYPQERLYIVPGVPGRLYIRWLPVTRAHHAPSTRPSSPRT
jgi:hypothetical protein